MILSQEIRAHARKNTVPESTIERDYAQNWLLKSLFDANPSFIFKGGTGIRKAHIPNYRFSDDIDLGLSEPWRMHELLDLLNGVVGSAREESGIAYESPAKLLENVNGFEGAVYLRLLRRSGSPLKIKLDITKFDNEIIVFPLNSLPLVHPYSDGCSCMLNVYSLKETLCEKVRALFERTRPRDLYDIFQLMGRVDPKDIVRGTIRKFEFKSIPPDITKVLARKDYFQSAWETSLGHQLQDLPEFNSTFHEVIDFVDTILD